ncbi:MAG: Smr/MutS family protein [Spirochaetota bacterium]
MEEQPELPEAVELPIDGTLDLHAFNPKDVKELISDYLAECRSRGILRVRIIHGKGTGTLRRTVHSILERMKEVKLFKPAGEEDGGWGATIVILKPPDY